MQNVVTRTDEAGDNHEVVIFKEYPDFSGFIIREILETKNPEMRFQVGHLVMVPMRLPVFRHTTEMVDGKEEIKSVLIRHQDGDEIQKFLLHGTGRTREEALEDASNKLLRQEIAKAKGMREFNNKGR